MPAKRVTRRQVYLCDVCTDARRAFRAERTSRPTSDPAHFIASTKAQICISGASPLVPTACVTFQPRPWRVLVPQPFPSCASSTAKRWRRSPSRPPRGGRSRRPFRRAPRQPPHAASGTQRGPLGVPTSSYPRSPQPVRPSAPEPRFRPSHLPRVLPPLPFFVRFRDSHPACLCTLGPTLSPHARARAAAPRSAARRPSPACCPPMRLPPACSRPTRSPRTDPSSSRPAPSATSL